MAMFRTFIPFHDRDIQDVFAGRMSDMIDRIERYTDDEILANNEDFLVDNLYEEYKIISVNILEEDGSKRKYSEQKIQKENQFYVPTYDPEYITVDGIAIDLAIPFVGETVLFYCYGSTITFVTYPRIAIQSQYIYLHFEFELREGTENAIFANMCSQRDNAVNLLRGGIGNLKKDIDKFNARLRDNALIALRKKKSKVSSLHKLSELLEVPVQQTEYAKTHITVQRRIQVISHTNNPEPQYTISDSVYDDILRTIKHIGSSIEQTPSSYKSMKEEALRDVVLGNLNTIYLGRASGEAFRVGGKTDICIEEKNRAAFVAECKMWDGPKTIGEAIDQLDNYTTWRDCKTAIIIFVRKKDFLAIVDKTKANLEALPNIRYVKVKDKNEFDCSYNSKATPGQIIKMRCFLFNVEPGISKR